ncbi:MAG: hypothetical protein IMZ66_11050, partial [Planctomycetes bacterium]|nr:hypothetical protein [Planctomycetota bacterium]
VWAFQGHGFTGPEGYWSREVLPGILMIGLDTVQPGLRGGHVDPRQLEWLERILTENAGKTILVAAYHGLVPLHPLQEAAGWKHMTVDNAAAVLKVLDRHPNVVLMISGSNHFAAGQVSGRTVHLSGPSVSVWPLAYQLVRLTRKEVEPAWVPLGSEEMSRRAQERLLASPRYRGVFPLGEDGDTACIRLFGSKKTEVFALPGIRP